MPSKETAALVRLFQGAAKDLPMLARRDLSIEDGLFVVSMENSMTLSQENVLRSALGIWYTNFFVLLAAQ